MTTKYNKITEEYPLLFNQNENSQEPLALFGFECGEGWYDIINNMCATMYSEYKGAAFMLKETVSRIEKLGEREDLIELKLKYEAAQNKAIKRLPLIVQVKEKFGALRVYLEGGTNTPRGIAEMAEKMSETTCEVCGNKGELYTIGWYKTLCYEHAIEMYTKTAVDRYNKQRKEENEKTTENT